MAIKGKVCYRIPKGTQAWLVIVDNQGHIPMITERDVVYTEEDKWPDLDDTEYRFTLPPNDRRATVLIVQKEHVRVTDSFSQTYPPPYRRGKQ